MSSFIYEKASAVFLQTVRGHLVWNKDRAACQCTEIADVTLSVESDQ